MFADALYICGFAGWLLSVFCVLGGVFILLWGKTVLRGIFGGFMMFLKMLIFWFGLIMG